MLRAEDTKRRRRMQGNGSSGASAHSPGNTTEAVRLAPARRRVLYEVRYVCKRALDIGLSLALLIATAPALAVIALAIKLDSRGPVIFVQERAGSARLARRGQTWWEPRTFRCYKFRSMVADADDATHQSYISRFVNGKLDRSSSGFKLTGDARVTRVGRILRRSSLDELPQLVNVLKGEMSLVGPRPVPLYEVAEYEPWHYERLAALPGITGVWQVYGRGRVTFTEMMQMDIGYVRRPSITHDLKLLARTLPAVLAGKGAR